MAATSSLENSKQRNRSRWPLELLAMAAILGLGLWLRWHQLEYMEFTNDQAWPLSRAVEIAREGQLPVTGFSSSLSSAHGPVELYLLALPALLSTDPLITTAWVGLLQMAAVVVTFLVGRRFFSPAVGLAATLLYAANPWAAFYARKMWTPDMTALPAAIFLLALFGTVVGGNAWALLLVYPAYAVLFLTHPSAVILAPLLLLPVFIALRRGRWRRLLAGLAAALLVALPYLYHDAGRGFPSLRSYLISAGAAVVDLEGPKYILTLASGQYFPTMTGISFRGEWRLPVLPYANELAMLLLALGLIGGAWHALRDRTPPGQAHGLLAISFLVALAMSLRHSMPYYPHYFLITYPLQFLLIAVGAWQLTRLARRLNVVSGAASLAMVGIVAYLAISQVWFFSTYVQYLVSNGPIGVYGPPYRYSAAAARNLQTAMVETGADAIYIYSFLQRQPLDYLIGDNPAVRHIDPPTAAVAPADRTRTSLALLASDEIAVSGHSYNAPADDGAVVRGLKEQGFRELPEYRVVGPYDHTYYRLFVSTGADSVGDGAPQLAAPQNPVQLQTGLRLLGYNPPARLAPGQTGELRLLWQLPEVIDPSPALEYNLFVHLLDSSGKQVVSVDQELYRFASWREEDCMLSIIPIKAPPELSQQALTVRVGAYGRYDRAEVKWELGAGQTSLYLDLGETVVTAKPAAAAQPNIPVRASFSQQLTLLGYSIDSREGDSFNVALHWQAEATMHQNYTVSVQLLDRAGSLVAQHDAQPRGGTYPTRVWESGEVVIDPHSVPLDPKQRPQVTTLRVVVYDGISGGRLPVGSGDAFDQAVSLGKE